MISRVIVTLVVCLIEVIHMIIIIESYYLISLTTINSGIPNTLHCVKVIFVSTAFYFLFNQKINNYDVIGIGFCSLWVIFIALSGSGLVVDEFSWNFIFSGLLILLAIMIQVPKIIITKHYFCYGDNDVNMIHFKVFHDVILFSIIVQL